MPEFRPGDLILSSTPFAYILNNSERGKRCDSCFSKKENLKRCSRCSFVYFCDTECQKRAWGIHKTECKNIVKAHPNVPTASLRFISHILIKIKKCGVDDPSVDVYNRKMSFRLLKSHAQEIKQDLKSYQQMLGLVEDLKVYIGCENVPSPAEMIEIYGKMCINTFSICDQEMQSIGCGLYIGASAFDHSCEPDAEIIFDGIKICIRAVRDISTCDISQVFVSYIDQFQLTNGRQEYLRSHYYFNCRCKRCTSQDFDKLITKTLVSEEKAKAVEKHSEIELENLKELKKKKVGPSILYEACMKELENQEGVLDDCHILKVKVLEIAFDTCIDLNQWNEAIAIGNLITEPYRLCYGFFHPNLGIHLFKMGKIEKLLERFFLAEKHLLEAEEITKVVYGCQHSLYQDLMEVLKECQEDKELSCR